MNHLKIIDNMVDKDTQNTSLLDILKGSYDENITTTGGSVSYEQY